MFAYDERDAVLLLYGERNSVNLGGREIFSPPPGKLVTRVWKVHNSREVRVSLSEKGSDRETTLLVSPGESVREVGEMVEQPFYFKGELCYVKVYMSSPPPDGGDYPTQRVVCGGEVVYGKDLKPGEFVSVRPFGDLLTLVRSKGWRHQELFVGEDFGGMRKVDEGETVGPVGFSDTLIYRRNDSVLTGSVTIKVDYPVLDVVLWGDLLAVEVIKDYRTPILTYDLLGRKLDEETHDNVLMMDSEGPTLFLTETSFSYRVKVSSKREGRENVILSSGSTQVHVKDVYVQGDVLLHGFLLTKVKEPKGVVVYGYGGFRLPLLPSYNPVHNVLMDDGFSVLITNLRGGYEKGEEWHKAGMLKNKVNVFRDFAQFLEVVKGMGGRTVAMGGSNGGLLVGATLNQRPELVDCAVIGHPVLDMLRYHKLYVGKYWVEEYGDPEDPEMRDYLLSYSPYHNLRGGLPKTFVYTGLNDDRVHPGHGIKYAARSRELGNDVLLFVNDTGHSVADPELRAREYSYVVAFIEECLR
ncbi:prolyl oligopeptidase family serine peptidase [Metallosphaera tengchongensis]|uniref:prolyl oligopeptidase family serine peptidase n=1 Tax=Metallosphaera tengchongensis TaxID=1532350 RepID=UPI001FE6F385|nr:prolyl oligopeptidase family serine peptidase [Metallosphaera tengchongensis]